MIYPLQSLFGCYLHRLNTGYNNGYVFLFLLLIQFHHLINSNLAIQKLKILRYSLGLLGNPSLFLNQLGELFQCSEIPTILILEILFKYG